MRISWIVSSSLLVAACGGTSPEPQTPASGSSSGSAAAKAPAGDVSFDVAPSELKGIVFAPEALGRPGIPTVKAKGDNGKKPPTDAQVDRQRKAYATTKDPVVKEANAEILASMLYRQSDTLEGDAEKKKIDDARQVLADFAGAAGDKVDDTTWWMLASYQLLGDDLAGAEKSWAAAVNKAPTSPNAPVWRAWWTYTLLREGKNPDALAVVKDQTLSDKQPELAYAAAWARWRNNDDAGAWQAIVLAAKGWDRSDKTGRDILKNNLLLFASRANISLDDALPGLTAYFGSEPAQKLEVLTTLGLSGYKYAGRWQDAITADDRALALSPPPNAVVSLRFAQADAAVRLDRPDAVAKYAKQALDALVTCGDKCTASDKENVAEGVFGIAARFHLLYSTSNDSRYRDAARALYDATGPVLAEPRAKEMWKQYSDNLAATFKNMKVGTGTHDKDAISWLLKEHDQEVQACYEVTLAANPKLGGTITVNLESDQTGVIKGVSTDPKAGLSDLSAVAGCTAEHVKTWKLPQRGMAGATRIKLTYNLAPKTK
jgi:hypothetical protein